MASSRQEIGMAATADICMIVEGGYPYAVGGVASWADALIRELPQLTFHIVAINISSQPRRRQFVLHDNVLDVTDVLLDICPPGRAPNSRDAKRVEESLRLLERVLTTGDASGLTALLEQLRATGFGQAALLDSRPAWRATEQAYQRLLNDGSLLDFFWSWRFLARSVLAVLHAPLPQARVFHAVATGFSGLLGSFASWQTKRPLLLTEHGIYTNERRIDLAVADWLFDSGAAGFDTSASHPELRAIWLEAFRSFSRISYGMADVIITQYRANQVFQCQDGAPEHKLRIIPNGIDAGKLAGLRCQAGPRRPTVLMLGRIVPIKDIRSFIMAVALLKLRVPEVLAIIIGPEDEDPGYAAGCRRLVEQLGLGSAVEFLGRVPDVRDYLVCADVLALASISEAQPLAVLEAGATGLPVVSTDVGSCREIIEGFDGDPVAGRGGLVVEPCNPKALAEALAEVLLDEARRAEMGDVMRRRAAQYYHKERVRRLYEELYRELMTPGAHASEHQSHAHHQQQP
jgi:polysaccharide biosynthesis protein PelF